MTTKEQLVLYYQLLSKRALNDSHNGNGSVRLSNDTFAITKTSACADTIQTDQLIQYSLTRNLPKKASLDASIHKQVYQTLNECNAILHSHNPYTIALTLNTTLFSPVDFEGKLYFGDLTVIPCEEENYLEVMPERITRCLKKQPIAIIQSHGVYAAADNIELAYKWLCSIEQSAKIKWLAQQL